LFLFEGDATHGPASGARGSATTLEAVPV
jgi:hypothetical protein